MSMRNLKLRVDFEAIDKISGSVRSIAKGTKGMTRELVAARDRLKELERVQAKLSGFRKLKTGLSQAERQLKDKQRAVADLAREMKRTEKPTAALTKKFTAAKKAAAKTKQELGSKRQELERLRRSLDKAGYSTADMVASERKLRGEIDKTTRALDRQQKGLANLHRLKAKGLKIRNAGIGMTAGITAPTLYFFDQFFEAAMDAQELQSAFDQTFQHNRAEMNKWAVETGDLLGRSTEEMQRGANAFGLFFNEAAPPGRAAAMAREMAVVAQDLESFHNLRPGEGISKLRAGLSGESEPLKQLGIMLNETAVKAKAYEMGLAKVGSKLTENQKITARYALIMEKTENAQGDIFRTWDSTANSVRRAKASMDEFRVAVGEKLLPQLTPVINKFADLLERFNNLPPGVQSAIVVFVALMAVIGPLLLGIAGIVSAIGVIGPAFAAISAPVWLTIGAVVAVIAILAALAYAVYTHWDTIEAAFWSGVGAVSQAWENLKAFLNAGFEWFIGLHVKFLNIGLDIVQGIADGIRNGAAAVWDALKNVVWGGIDKVRNFLGIKSPSRVFMRLGGFASEGMAIGITRQAQNAVAAAGKMASGVTAAGSLALAPPIVATAAPISKAPIPAPAAASSAAAAAPAQQQGVGLTLHFHLTQQPGESADEFAERVIRKIEEKAGISRRSDYEDDD